MGSYAQMVIDNEIAAGVKRLCRGITVDEDSLAVDIIAEVMSGNRNFLSQPHTVKYLRQGEMLLTNLAERGGWETWDRSGRLGMGERAASEANRIKATHRVTPLEQDQEKELDGLLNAALQDLQGETI